MPTYQANPFYSDPNIQRAAQSLAETLAGGSARRMNAEIAGNQARADLDATRAREAASYASASSSNALAGKYGAETGILNMKKAALDGLAQVWADPSKDFNTKMREMGQFIAAGELTEDEVSSYFLLGPAHGLSMEDMDRNNFARDGNYNNTMHAWNREPEIGYVGGVPTLLPREKAFGLQTPISETEAKGFSFMQLPPVDQNAVLFGQTGLTTAMVDGMPRAVREDRAIAEGMTMPLSETEVRGSQRLAGTLNDAPERKTRISGNIQIVEEWDPVNKKWVEISRGPRTGAAGEIVQSPTDKVFAADDAATLETALAGGLDADYRIGEIDQTMAYLQAGTPTGFWTDNTLTIQQALVGLGIGDPDRVAKIEAVTADLGNRVMDRIQETKGAVSNAEMDYFRKISASIGKTPQGNLRLLEAERRVWQRLAKMRAFAQTLRNQSPEQVSAALDQFRRENPLWSPEELSNIDLMVPNPDLGYQQAVPGAVDLNTLDTSAYD